MNRHESDSISVQLLEPRVLLAYSATMNPSAAHRYTTDFFINASFPATFSGATKGTVSTLGGGNYRYTPNIAALGTDTFSYSYQPQYGGYTPPRVTGTIQMNILFAPYGASTDEDYTNTDPATNTAYPKINYFALKDNTLNITADKGLLKNDTLSQFVPYLKHVKWATANTVTSQSRQPAHSPTRRTHQHSLPTSQV